MDTESPWCVVAYTEMMVVKAVAFILFEAYYSGRLWALSRYMIEGIRRLKLKTILSNAHNLAECRRLLDAIELSSFRDLPPGWSARSMRPSF